MSGVGIWSSRALVVFHVLVETNGLIIGGLGHDF